MNTVTRNLVGALRRSWLGLVAVSLVFPLALAIQALWFLDAHWASVAENIFTLGGVAATFAGLVGGLMASLQTQPKRRGQGTFERIHSLAEPPRSEVHMLAEPPDDHPPPNWISSLARRLPEPFSMLERGVAVATLAAVLFLTHAPDNWITSTLGSFWLDPQIRASAIFGLIGVATFQSFRLTCQNYINRVHRKMA